MEMLHVGLSGASSMYVFERAGRVSRKASQG